jgi:DNA polymerase III delta prime subunit
MTAPGWGPYVGDVDIAGDASQNAVGNRVSGDLVQNMTKFVRGIPTWYLGSEEIVDRVACYLPALNHDLIEKALEMNHAVLLIGPPGCGRETTAIAAISHLRPDIPIRRFCLDREDAEEIDAKGACGYLVRAADGGLGRLGQCVDAVRASCGYLVVIGDEADQKRTTPSLPCMPVEPPNPVQVYRHRLTRRGLHQWSSWDRAPALLEDALPSNARRLTDLIEQAHQRGGDIAKQREDVAQEYRGWTDDLRGWFDDHREPHERALLAAAATLSPAAEETDVYSAASSLARRLEITMNGAGLVWCPLTSLREMLMADPEEDRIVFRRHGFARSALRHTLADYPLARSDLITWLAALPTDESVTHRLPESLAETFADLAAEHGMAGHITEASGRWGKDGHADLAFIALSLTCLHPLVGGKVRQALYEWSRTASTPQTLKLTIARVCQPLGQTYPSIALTRLKHLATYGDAYVVHEVISAALGLVETGSSLEVLMAALSWSAETNAERLSAKARQCRIRAGAMLFLELAGRISPSGLPEVLHGKGAVDPLECTPGWRAALYARSAAGEGRDTAFEETAYRWLDAALLAPRLRGRIVSAFVDAAMPRAVPLGYPNGLGPVDTGPIAAKTMIHVARRWAAADPTNTVRRKIKEDIVIPLTSPWWLRLLKFLYVWVRTLITTIRQQD